MTPTSFGEDCGAEPGGEGHTALGGEERHGSNLIGSERSPVVEASCELRSVVRADTSNQTCLGCASSSITPADARDAVHDLLALARRLLVDDVVRISSSQVGREVHASALGRVARLRDELHATANRVARFALDEHPTMGPILIPAPRIALASEQLLYQLALAAGRLIALLEPLSETDWRCTGRIDGATLALGQLVEAVLHDGASDLAALLTAAGDVVGGSPTSVGVATGQRRAPAGAATG